MTALVLADLALPFLFAIGHSGELIRDVAMYGQLSLLLISLTLLGIRWPGIILLLLGGALHFGIWFVIYGETMRLYVFNALVVPGVVLAVAVTGLRWWGWRGSWQPLPESGTPPWQVSIRQLLFVTTAVAIAFAGANWLRLFPNWKPILPALFIGWWLASMGWGCLP